MRRFIVMDSLMYVIDLRSGISHLLMAIENGHCRAQRWQSFDAGADPNDCACRFDTAPHHYVGEETQK